jgi:glycosyltransferase involved in cell wall biosynthesis
MREWGFDVTVVASPGEDLDVVSAREQVRTVAVPIERGIAPAGDAVSLARLIAVMRDIRPHIVNASTPKAGLLGMLAARAAGVPVRIYLLRGLRLETTHGLQRLVLSATERLASACAHRVVSVSESLRRAYLAEGCASAEKTVVLGAGTSNGVDIARFERTPERVVQARSLRRQLGFANDDGVIGFVGRFVADKGIGDVLDAFDALRRARPAVRLLLVGGDFGGDLAPAGLARRIRETPGLVSVGIVADVGLYYQVMDVLAFPSLREGFPNAPLEAAAAGVPTVGYRVTGVIDAIGSEVTGHLVKPGDSEGFAQALHKYLEEPALGKAHGRAAAERAARLFSQEAVWRRWREEYIRLLAMAGAG